jgi:hypothetical protein
MDEKKLALITQGKSAEFTLGLVKPFIDEQRAEVIQRMKTLYAARDTDGIKYIAAAAELCTLDALENKFVQKIKTANRLSEEREHAAR